MLTKLCHRVPRWYNTHRSHLSPDRLTLDEAYFVGLPQLKIAV